MTSLCLAARDVPYQQRQWKTATSLPLAYIVMYPYYQLGTVLGDCLQNGSPYAMSVCPVCDVDVGLLWPNGWMDKDVTWYS